MVTGAPMSRRAGGVYNKIGVNLVKGWVLLESVCMQMRECMQMLAPFSSKITALT